MNLETAVDSFPVIPSPTSSGPPVTIIHESKRRTRAVARRACLSCRERKIKCDGVHVCRSCKQFNTECIFVRSRRGGRRSRIKPSTDGSTFIATPETAQLAAGNIPVSSDNDNINNTNNNNNNSENSMSSFIAPNGSDSDHSILELVQSNSRIPGMQIFKNSKIAAPFEKDITEVSQRLPNHLPAESIISRDRISLAEDVEISPKKTFSSAQPPMHPTASSFFKPDPIAIAMPTVSGPHYSSPAPVLPAYSVSSSSPDEMHSAPDGPLINNLSHTSNKCTPSNRSFSSIIGRQDNDNPAEYLTISKSISDMKSQIDDLRSLSCSTHRSSSICVPHSCNSQDSLSYGPVLNSSASDSISPDHAEVYYLKNIISEQQILALDFPTQEIAEYLIDLYYEYFHYNHPFIFPRPYMLQTLSLKQDASFLHSIFAIACRYLSIDRSREQSLHVFHYYKDPLYWISMSKKHQGTLNAFKLLQSHLLNIIALSGAGFVDHAREFLKDCSKIVRVYKLDKACDLTPEITDNTQLMDRESLVRTLWEIWRYETVQYMMDPSIPCPPFSGHLSFPVADEIYDNIFRYWNRKCYYWNDLETDLLNSLVPPDEDNSIEAPPQDLHTDWSLLIAGLNLVSSVCKFRYMMTERLRLSFDHRLQQLCNRMSLMERRKFLASPSSSTAIATQMKYRIAHATHEALAMATSLIHYGSALNLITLSPRDLRYPDFKAYESEQIPILQSRIDFRKLNSADVFDKIYNKNNPNYATRSEYQSYSACQYASHMLFYVLTRDVDQTMLNSAMAKPGNVPFPKSLMSELHQNWAKFSPYSGQAVIIYVGVLASDLLLRAFSEKNGYSDKERSRDPNLDYHPGIHTKECIESSLSSQGQPFLTFPSWLSVDFSHINPINELKHKLRTLIAFLKYSSDFWVSLKVYVDSIDELFQLANEA